MVHLNINTTYYNMNTHYWPSIENTKSLEFPPRETCSAFLAVSQGSTVTCGPHVKWSYSSHRGVREAVPSGALHQSQVHIQRHISLLHFEIFFFNWNLLKY